jgi:hypothetical protein
LPDDRFGIELGVLEQRPRSGLRVRASRTDCDNAVLGLEHIARSGNDQRSARIGNREHRFQPAQNAVGTPVLRQLDRGTLQLPLMLIELGLEALEQRECIGSRTGKAGQHAITVKTSHLACGRLHHDVAERNLAVAAEGDRRAATDGEDGCSVKLLSHMHFGGFVNRRAELAGGFPAVRSQR